MNTKRKVSHEWTFLIDKTKEMKRKNKGSLNDWNVLAPFYFVVIIPGSVLKSPVINSQLDFSPESGPCGVTKLQSLRSLSQLKSFQNMQR